MSSNEILSGQRDCQALFRTIPDSGDKSYVEPHLAVISDDAIFNDLARVGALEVPAWSQRCTLRPAKNDALGAMFLKFGIPENSNVGGVVPLKGHMGFRALRTIRILHGNNELASYDYEPVMQMLMSRLPDGERDLLTAASMGRSSIVNPGTLANSATSICVPIPWSFDRLMTGNNAAYLDLRALAGNIQVEASFKSINEAYGEVMTTNNAPTNVELFYMSAVYSTVKRTDNAISTQDIRENVQYKTRDVENTPLVAIPNGGVPASIDLSPYVGCKADIALNLYAHPLADMQSGVGSYQNTVYPAEVVIFINGREYFRAEHSAAQFALIGYYAGNNKTAKDYNAIAVDEPLVASSRVYHIPVGLDQASLSSWSGGIDITQVNSISMRVRQFGPIEYTGQVVMMTDALLKVRPDRTMEKQF